VTDLDLTERLALAAADAVRAPGGALEAGGPSNLNGITVEPEPANGGATVDLYTYLSWRSVIRDAKRKVG
jgi:hypothetical protein